MYKPRRATLTEPQVIIIKQRLLAGEYPHQIAPDFGVTARNIRYIRDNKAWKRVPPSMAHLKRKPGNPAVAILTEPQVIEIRRKRRAGYYWRELAEEYGVSQFCIRAAVLGWSWAHVHEDEI